MEKNKDYFPEPTKEEYDPLKMLMGKASSAVAKKKIESIKWKVQSRRWEVLLFKGLRPPAAGPPLR